MQFFPHLTSLTVCLYVSAPTRLRDSTKVETIPKKVETGMPASTFLGLPRSTQQHPTQITITSPPDVQLKQTIHQSKAKNKGYTFRMLEFQLCRPSPSLKQLAWRQCKTTIRRILLICTFLLETNQHENRMALILCINLLAGDFLCNYDEKLRRYATVTGSGCVQLVNATTNPEN